MNYYNNHLKYVFIYNLTFLGEGTPSDARGHSWLCVPDLREHMGRGGSKPSFTSVGNAEALLLAPELHPLA